MEAKKELVNTFLVELKRGTVTLAVLSQLKEPEYGYSLLEKLVKEQLPIESNTLYPLLRRLEKQGILLSQWSTEEARPRKYYKLSSFGEEVYELLKKEWKKSVDVMQSILREG
ncbi:PadR family transcriptional regulator [Proteiniclasticum sp. C24MP]|uniref:PadR family transcriptional regulator n=1 Tax=Proteiniclasticum sp. C24MP TaxID=3374101 RepID=UPI003754D2AD